MKKITKEQIIEAVAKAWTRPINAGKNMDVDLGETIVWEVMQVIEKSEKN